MAGQQRLLTPFIEAGCPTFIPRGRIRVATILIAVTCFSTTTFAQSQSRFPAFTGERVYVSDVSGSQWNSIRNHIAKVEKSSRQTYYVVVVKSSGRGSKATAQYIDAMYGKWQQQATQQNRLDANRAVIIVVAIGNRQLSVHAGTELQTKYGLRGQTIDRKLVTPHFTPHARAGNFVAGVNTLIDKIDAWVKNIDSKEQQSRQRAIVRTQQIKKDARATVKNARQLSTAIDQLIAQQSDSHLDFSALAKRANTALASLDRIESDIEANGPQSLKAAAAVQQMLASTRDQIRQMATHQHDAQKSIAAAHAQADRIAEQIEKHSQAGLAVFSSGKALDKSSDSLTAAEQLINSDPKQALQVASQQVTALQTLLNEVDTLPDQQKIVAAQLQAIGRLQDRMEPELKRATALGVVTREDTDAIARSVASLANANTLSESNYTAAIAQLDSLQSSLSQQRAQLKQKADHQYFITRTVPLWICISLVAVGLIALIVLRVLHMLARRPLQIKLKTFKTNVVELSDSLDALKERHRMLPFTDDDFKEPMTGETLSTYNSVQESLEQFRQRWLTLMDTWQQAQENLDTEQFFGRSQLKTATKLIDEAPVDDVLHSISEQCIATLDGLENAHEQQQHLEKTLTEEVSRLRKQLDLVRQVDLSTEPYDIELKTAFDRRDAVADMRVSDPIGSRGEYEHVVGEVRRLGRWTEQILHHHEGSTELNSKLDEVTKSTQQHRDQGYRFCEDGSDPAVLFPKIRHHRSECLTLLNSGEAKTAAEHLTQGFGLIASAKERIARQVECRELCANEATLRPAEQERLRSSLTGARQTLAQLDLAFSDHSWDDVANNADLAEQTIARSEELIREAAQSGSDSVQFYVSAAEQYERIQQQQIESASLVAAINQRLSDLEGLRNRANSEIATISQLADQVHQLLISHTADRPAANHRFQHAQASFRQAEEQALATKVDWQDVVNQIEVARREFDIARKMAAEDIRLAAQAASEIAQAEREIRQASSFYRHGYRANVSTASHQVAQALEMLGRQDYETTIRLANEASASARSAQRDAQNMADAKQRKIDRRRRERQAAFAIGSSNSSRSNSFGSSGFGASSSSGSFSSSSSSSSWDSGTSTSNW